MAVAYREGTGMTHTHTHIDIGIGIMGLPSLQAMGVGGGLPCFADLLCGGRGGGLRAVGGGAWGG